jgi:hypothetical protein
MPIPKSVYSSLVGNVGTEQARECTNLCGRFVLPLQYRLTMECEPFGYRFRYRHQLVGLGLINAKLWSRLGLRPPLITVHL